MNKAAHIAEVVLAAVTFAAVPAFAQSYGNGMDTSGSGSASSRSSTQHSYGSDTGRTNQYEQSGVRNSQSSHRSDLNAGSNMNSSNSMRSDRDLSGQRIDRNAQNGSSVRSSDRLSGSRSDLGTSSNAAGVKNGRIRSSSRANAFTNGGYGRGGGPASSSSSSSRVHRSTSSHSYGRGGGPSSSGVSSSARPSSMNRGVNTRHSTRIQNQNRMNRTNNGTGTSGTSSY